jgi:hypothetical protein
MDIMDQKKIITTRQNEIILLIQRQTGYTREQCEEKLKTWNNNYINVIKEYMNPEFNKSKETSVKTTNQAIMGEIRNFMDTANKGYEIRKKREQLSKEKYEKTVEFYNRKIKEKVAFACNIWKDAPKSCWLDKEVISVLMKYKINDPNGLSGKTFHGFYFTPHTE